jgi:hypothetical protein
MYNQLQAAPNTDGHELIAGASFTQQLHTIGSNRGRTRNNWYLSITASSESFKSARVGKSKNKRRQARCTKPHAPGCGLFMSCDTYP